MSLWPSLIMIVSLQQRPSCSRTHTAKPRPIATMIVPTMICQGENDQSWIIRGYSFVVSCRANAIGRDTPSKVALLGCAARRVGLGGVQANMNGAR